MKLTGVWVAVVSFFNKDFSLDLPRFRAHCEWLLDCGVEGLVPCGTTGEGPTLTSLEREQLINTSVELAEKKGKKVIAGCGGNNTATVKALIEAASHSGAHAALVVTPYYNKPSQAGLVAHYEHLADHSNIPIVLYNVPSRTGVNLLPETVIKLWQHPRLVGLKEASGNHSQWLALTSPALPENRYLLAGDDDAYATLFSLGASGIISASANVVPQLFVQLDKHLRANEWQAAWGLQKRLFPLIQSFFSETNPGPIKYFLSRMGKGLENLRLPLVAVNAETQKKIDFQLKAWELVS